MVNESFKGNVKSKLNYHNNGTEKKIGSTSDQQLSLPIKKLNVTGSYTTS